jgi:hypothetical protein
VDLSHSQLTTGLLENRHDRVADSSEVASAIRRHSVSKRVSAACLFPVTTRETLEEGREVVV